MSDAFVAEVLLRCQHDVLAYRPKHTGWPVKSRKCWNIAKYRGLSGEPLCTQHTPKDQRNKENLI
jgi:hypothetical protein